MASMSDGETAHNIEYGVGFKKVYSKSDKEKIEHLLNKLKAIARGVGTDPRIYAANCVDQFEREIRYK